MATFRTRARAVDLLGKQQIRDEVTAISELLRNAYDADATEGLIDVDTNRKRIFVWDDGDGMTKEEMEGNWLTLGTYSKFKSEDKPTVRGRVKIGEKGIGRLAISLLGDQLLIISKKRELGVWSILYLHWELFRNERVFLEDIEVPTRSFNTFRELVNYLQNDFSDLKNILLTNLRDINEWDKERLQKIRKDVEELTISNDLINRLNINETRGAGTTFYITGIDADWDWDVYRYEVKEDTEKERARRMKDLLFSFANFFNFYERNRKRQIEGLDEEKPDFVPKIHINGKRLEDEAWFSPDDLDLFDYTLEGEIREGEFFGIASIRTSMGLVEKKDVTGNPHITKGINSNSRAVRECGPIKIKWFFVEGAPELSSLQKDEHNKITDKLNEIGGIYVYRDGLRILPYGEPGNDFLKIEERRTKRFSTYLFSHRRMFGYMEINKRDNPRLIDKSSREGFVENSVYNYFKTAAINLLVWWATDYLGSRDDQGLRATRNRDIEAERMRKRLLEEKQKREKEEEKIYILSLHNRLVHFQDTLTAEEKSIRSEIEQQISRWRSYDLLSLKDLGSLHESVFRLKNSTFSKINSLDELKITLNHRFTVDHELEDEVEEANKQIENLSVNLRLFAETSINELVKMAEKRILDYQASLSEREKLQSLVYEIDTCLVDAEPLLKSVTPEESSVLMEIQRRIEEVKMNLVQWLKSSFEVDRAGLKTIQVKLEICKSKLLTHRDELNNLHNQKDFVKFIGMVQEDLNHFHSTMNEVRQKKLEYGEIVLNSEHVELAHKAVEDILKRVSEVDSWEAEDMFVGFLKREVETYRSLSAVGLAAELTSHEFNSLYQRIKENLLVLQNALSKTRVAPLIEQMRKAFFSLERLHQRMSPLYRQTRTRRKTLYIKDFVDDVLEYFSSDLARYDIKTVVDIEQDETVKETEAVLFTPLVNLLSNAIYWMIDRDVREIHIYTDPLMGRLYVHDSGPGVRQQDAERIFQPFFTKRKGGRGLGLFLSRDITESRGHRLMLIPRGHEPKDLSGACFCLEFNKETYFEVNSDNE